jgi:hypothetical protein
MTPVIQFDSILNRSTQTSNYYSPRQFSLNKNGQQPNNYQSPYCKPLNVNTNIVNKENKSPLVLSSNINAQKQQQQQKITPSKNEIFDAAQRIITKRQESIKNGPIEIRAIKNNRDSSDRENLTTNSNNNLASSLVKNMKSKFEDPNEARKSVSNVTLQPLNPKSIIKKFEMLSQQPVHQQQQQQTNINPFLNVLQQNKR